MYYALVRTGGGALLALATGCRSAPPGLPQARVPVPVSPDSAWAVGVAARQLGAGAVPYRVLGFRAEPDGYLVRLTPGGPPAVLGGGGLVWVGRQGAVVVLAVYQ